MPRARFAMGMLWLCAGSAALTVALHAWLFGRLEGGQVSSEDAEVYDSLIGLLALPSVLGFILSAVVFLFWLHLATRNANALGLSQEEPRWAMLCWFIPLVHLVKPYHVVHGLWVSLGGAGHRTSLFSGWWAAWIISNILSRAEQRIFQRVEKDPFILSGALLVGIAAEAVALLAAVLCIRVVLVIQRRLDARRAEAMDVS